MEAVEFRGRVMASDLHIITLGATSAMVDEVLVLLDHLERCWSRFIATSDISRINVMPAGGALAVDDATLTLLSTMVEGHRLTGGRFDPTVLPALVREGYATSRVDATRTTTLHPHDVPASLDDIELDQLGGMVTVPVGLALDPGGIGKGLAADLAVAWLLDVGARGALVSIGGDMAMAGDSPESEGWSVQVEQPDPNDGALCTLAISGGGVATSSTRSRRWMHDGRERHHQIDPATALPSSTDLVVATIIAGAGWLAEVHATAAIACGSEGVVDYMARHGLSGIAVDHDGSAFLSPDLVDIELLAPVGAR
jgi:thiamine biosynthesis lipoprotein